MTKRTAICERSPESHWHSRSWLLTCRKQDTFHCPQISLFPPSVKAHLTEPLAVLLEAASLWYMTLSDNSYFSEAPTNASVHVSLTSCCCCRCKQIWDKSFYRAFCTPQHVVCACSVPHFPAGLCPCHSFGMSPASSWNKQHVQLSNLCTHLLLLHSKVLSSLKCNRTRWQILPKLHVRFDSVTLKLSLRQLNLHLKKIKAKAPKLLQNQLQCKLESQKLPVGNCL